jgi:hypothetical protein
MIRVLDPDSNPDFYLSRSGSGSATLVLWIRIQSDQKP